MEPALERKSVALALLAVLVGAIVQITHAEGPFTPWQSLVGLIMLSASIAYSADVGRSLSECICFALIVAAGVLFTIGFLLDPLLEWLKLIELSVQNSEIKVMSPRVFSGVYLHDLILCVLWLLIALLVLYVRPPRSS